MTDDAALADDQDARLEYLVDRRVLRERDDGTVVATDDFHATLSVYEDTYLEAPEPVFVETVADVFDLARERAADRIETTGTTRRELAIFLALRASLEDPERTPYELALLARTVAAAGPGSPVPDDLLELDDGSFESALAGRDVVVLVLQRHCPPCEALKADLPALRAAAPDAVGFAGVDGDDAPRFRQQFDVSVAPATLVFAGGDLRERVDGRRSVEELTEAFDAAYGTAPE